MSDMALRRTSAILAAVSGSAAPASPLGAAPTAAEGSFRALVLDSADKGKTVSPSVKRLDVRGIPQKSGDARVWANPEVYIALPTHPTRSSPTAVLLLFPGLGSAQAGRACSRFPLVDQLQGRPRHHQHLENRADLPPHSRH